jgi:hypothetical protein
MWGCAEMRLVFGVERRIGLQMGEMVWRWREMVTGEELKRLRRELRH